MYLKNCLYVFVFVSLTTFVLNYTVVRNLDDNGTPKSPMTVVVAKPTVPMSEPKTMLAYRRNRSSEESVQVTPENYISAFLSEDNKKIFANNSFFNCGLNEYPNPNEPEHELAILDHNAYTVYINYAVGSRSFVCNESITYTTHGEFRYLDNLVPLVERWEGPISMALYAPGNDFAETVKRIHFLRECTSPMIKELVSFHIFYDKKYTTDTVVPDPSILENGTVDCGVIPSFSDEIPSFRRDKKLSYPVNVARNLARKHAATHFVLMSDVELYPSLNIIPLFINMIIRNEAKARAKAASSQVTPKPRVYVLPIFEVEEGYPIPDTKKDLRRLLETEKAVPFHKYVCPECHKVPKYSGWVKADRPPNELNIYHVAKRRKPFHMWEPIYIGTNQEPLYDERLTWEGLRDKMSQGYLLCLFDYEFMILDNAFLVHRPGIKKRRRSKRPSIAIRRQNRILDRVQMEFDKKYGKKHGCFL